MVVDLEAVRAARERIKGHVHRTPVLRSSYFDQKLGAELFFKCENFQKVGAFKIRGASNAVLSLSDEEAARGVCAHSSGNHAQALALAARRRGIKACIIMPKTAPCVKLGAVRDYGAEILLCEPTQQAREETTRQYIEDSGATYIPSYDDDRVIAGQGTAALEFLEEVPELDMILVPVGGGGLVSGTALAASGHATPVKVIGSEPECADDARRSLEAGRILPSDNPDTIADGLRTSLGQRTFPLIQRFVDSIVTASEESILLAMRNIWERMKIVVEPSSAVPLAAVLEKQVDVKGKKVGIIFSGGNVEFSRRSALLN